MATIPAAGPQWFGHPRQLARLFTTEAMERFGYYGMRALLTLYLADHFLFSDSTTTSLYGGFTALVYLTPLVGGLIADRYLGSKRSVKFGAIVMSAGYLTLCFGGTPATPFATIDGARYEVVVDRTTPAKQQYVVDHGRRLAIHGNDDGSVTLTAPDGTPARQVSKGGFVPGGDRSPLYTAIMLLGLSAVTIGNGFFKPNISTMVGSLYATGDRRRDAGFTIFYMGINLGSLFSQLLCPLLAVGGFGWAGLGWWAGFGLAAIGMAVSWALIQFAGPKMAGIGETPVAALGTDGKDRSWLIYALALLAIPVVWLLFTNLMAAPPPVKGEGFIGHPAGDAGARPGADRDVQRRGDRHPDLVAARRDQGGVPDDAGGDRPHRLQRRLLVAVRAGGVEPDAVRRPQHRHEHFRPVLDLGRADAVLQRLLHHRPRAHLQRAVARAGEAWASSRASRSSSASR